MSHSYCKVWIHIVWSTKDRFPLLNTELREKLILHIHEQAHLKGYSIKLINGIEDHLHCLISLDPKFSLSQIMNYIKGESSHWINKQNFLKARFSWQEGFGAFSVSEKEINKIIIYIQNQQKYHKNTSFAKEWDTLLEEHNLTEIIYLP